MRPTPREIGRLVQKAARAFPVVLLTGPRRVGKTFLLKTLFPKASHVLFENPALVERVRKDPNGFINELRPPVVLDEIQNVPELNAYIRERVDRQPALCGRWVLTGSQEASLMKGITESLAGRVAVLSLLPFSYRERKKWDLFLGGFPEVINKPSAAGLWFTSYIQTYLERDIRSLAAIHDLPTFRRFLSLLAARHGQTLNKTDLAAPLGLSVPTIGKWLDLVETTGHILVVPPYFRNFSKRLVKSPKVYWVDSGLVCYLLGLESKKQMESSPFLGPLLEGFVAAEIVKNQINAGRRKEVYYFRDERGLEVDFVLPSPNGALSLVDVKSTHTPTPAQAHPLQNLLAAVHKELAGQSLQAAVVYRSSQQEPNTTVLVPGVQALTVEAFLQDHKFS